MTKEYALRKLLEHGDLSKFEIRDITHWRWHEVDDTLGELVKSGVVTAVHGQAAKRYRLK